MGGVWEKTACILCECNCGLEVQLGGENNEHFVRIRGDKEHPASKGYACEKAHRLDYYQHGRDRITSPLRKRADGTFEKIDWDTAITEVAERLAALRDEHGGETIFYYGGGGQGNHLPGAYSAATRRALNSRYRSSALAQEKTGEFWVSSQMFGNQTRGDFEHAEVALFIGKNPWFSHGMPQARVTLKAIKKDPARTMIVIDPRRTKTAEMADIHLQVKPGKDAWLIAAMAAILIEEDLVDHAWIEEHCDGFDEVSAVLKTVSISTYCEIAGVSEDLVRTASRRIAEAQSVASFEDLGVQMNRHSTLVSYMHRFLWVLTGNFAKKGAQYFPTPMVNIAGRSGQPKDKRSPVANALIIAGLVPCNVIAEEILTDHPKRYRAMIVESGNPAHSLADSQNVRKALESLDTLVVIDVAMTETAKLADYVLPTATQYEKAEATFFNFEFPQNYFHLRHPLFKAPDGVLTEAEIHARLCEALGAYDESDLEPLHAAAKQGRVQYAMAFMQNVLSNPKLMHLAPVLLYRTLGPTLPEGLSTGAVLWGAAQQYVAQHAGSAARAGFEAQGPMAANQIFDAIIDSPSGVVFAVDEPEQCWERVDTPNKRIQLAIDDLLKELQKLNAEGHERESEFPFVLSAGERRSFTANTILRNPEWRKKDAKGALRVSPIDAASLGVSSGDEVQLTTKRSSVRVSIEVSEAMQSGHISLPNGLGLGYPKGEGGSALTGVAPNELTASGDRDWLAGTPWHKHVPARIEAVS